MSLRGRLPWRAGMGGKAGVERRAGQALARLVHPIAWEDRIFEWTPYPWYGPLVRRPAHVAGRGAADECQRAVHSIEEAAPENPERTGFRIDETDRDRDAGGYPEH